MLQRLAALRQQREERAREALTVQTGLLRQAERKAEDAARAVRDHVQETRVREHALISGLAGRAVSLSAIVRIQIELDGAALEAGRRRAEEARAKADLQPRRSARAEALANFQLRQRAVARLEQVRKEEIARQTRRDAALADADAEDRAATAGWLP
jgi:hypothetical protein